jgi:hypothetical protein
MLYRDAVMGFGNGWRPMASQVTAAGLSARVRAAQVYRLSLIVYVRLTNVEFETGPSFCNCLCVL